MSDIHNNDMDFIFALYKTLEKPKNWPQVLALLDKYQNLEEKKDLENVLLHAAHLAESLRQKVDKLEKEKEQLQEILEGLPYGIVQLDQKLDVLITNNNANKILQQQKEWVIENNAIKIPNHLEKKLRKNDKNLEKIIRWQTEDKQHTFWIIRQDKKDGLTQKGYLLFICDHSKETIQADWLKEYYGLTAKESRLIHGLLKYNNLNEVANHYYVSIHTVRTQLKSVFSKTNTHNQNALILEILQRNYQKLPITTFIEQKYADKTEIEYSFSLSDGRRLSWSELGHPNGRVYLYFESWDGTDPEFDDKWLKKQNIRLIIPRLPGIAGSSPHAQHSFLSWTDDICEFILSKNLNASPITLISHTLSSPYALACGTQLERFLKHIHLVSPLPPCTEENLAYFQKAGNYIFSLAHHLPLLLKELGPLLINSMLSGHCFWHDSQLAEACKTDRQCLNNATKRQQWHWQLKRKIQQGTQYIVDDFILLTQDWQFSLQAVKTPTTIWYGADDLYLPHALSQKLSQDIPDCDLVSIPDHGHFLIHYYWKKIFLTS